MPEPQCWCHVCAPITWNNMLMILCPTCGNKRCPRASNHEHSCTGSNDPGQLGSEYGRYLCATCPHPAICTQSQKCVGK